MRAKVLTLLKMDNIQINKIQTPQLCEAVCEHAHTDNAAAVIRLQATFRQRKQVVTLTETAPAGFRVFRCRLPAGKVQPPDLISLSGQAEPRLQAGSLSLTGLV